MICFVNSLENFYSHENALILLVSGFLSTSIAFKAQGVDALKLMALNVGSDNDLFFDKPDDEHIKCKAQSSNILTLNFTFKKKNLYYVHCKKGKDYRNLFEVEFLLF